MKESCVIGSPALLKILLHSLKHPSGACNGVLLGSLAEGRLEVSDAVPVAHGYVTLTPVLETALSQIEQHVQQQKGRTPGLRIVGYYQCNERLGDAELGAGRRVADRIEAAFPESVVLLLDSAALEAALKRQAERQDAQLAGSGDEPPLLLLFTKDGARGWGRVAPASGKPSFKCPTQGVTAQLAQFAAEGRHRSLADFEQHLDDITADWLNPGLLEGPA